MNNEMLNLFRDAHVPFHKYTNSTPRNARRARTGRNGSGKITIAGGGFVIATGVTRNGESKILCGENC